MPARQPYLSTISFLRNHKLKPKKSLGQNFLISQKAILKIVESANIKKDETIVEIGPGTGALTKELSKKAKKVIAIEKDCNLAKTLKKDLQNLRNIDIKEQDILKVKLNLKKYKVVASLPYYVRSY